ncbi:MAG TPA: hypothetical protein VLB27_12050, partial [candidate division Zixibacteria bacterium]|nr:hypothetical protein [candidate division Zixibacteria bacterium]
TSGYYLQAWPTTANGTVTTNNTALTIPNQNVISTDFLATVNLNRVGGTATATSTLGIGANLPSTATQGTTHKTDVQFFDTLGNANTTSLNYTKGNRDNQWDVSITPPSGVNVVTLFADTAGATVYESRGQLEFNGLPANDATMTIRQGSTTITYQFDTTGAQADTATVKQVDVSSATTVAQFVAALVAKVKASDTNFADHGGFTNNRIQVNPGSSTGIYFTDDGTGAITIDPTGLLTSAGARASIQESSYTVSKTATAHRDSHQFTFSSASTFTPHNTITVNGLNYELISTGSAAVTTAIAVTVPEMSTGGTAISASSISTFLSNLESAIETNDASFATGASTV